MPLIPTTQIELFQSTDKLNLDEMKLHPKTAPLRKNNKKRHIVPTILLLASSALVLSGCSAMLSSATNRFSDNLAFAFQNSEDPAVVADGAPAYLLMMDALIRDNPDDYSTIRAAAKLNASYADMFVEDSERLKILTEKALGLAGRSACLENPKLCDLRRMEFSDFEKAVAVSGPDDLDALFSLAGVWASWIQAHRRDWNAVAELSRVEAIIKRTVELDPEYENGQPYLYLGALATMLPPALGGKPEEGRAYFEKAIELSGGNNLYAKYLYAQRYARLVFDRELHDRLLNEVLEARPEAEGYRLANAIAKKKAEELLKTADDYF